jgi:hypothetical protein
LLVERWTGLVQSQRMSAHADRAEGDPNTPTNENRPKPYLTAAGDLVSPMLSEPKYHYWKPGGQKVRKTMEELQSNNGGLHAEA